MSERRARNWAAVHGGLFLAAWAAVALALPRLGWPWHFLLPLIAYWGVVLAWPALRRTAQRPALGRVAGRPLLAAILLAAISVTTLAIFHVTTTPDVTALADAIPATVFGSVIVTGLCFSVLNATMEELIFRGILYEAVAAEWGVAVAIGTTSVLFGVVHMHGYPPGMIGAVLAGLFGLGLGLLRWWTRGLGLAMAVHIGADAFIFFGVLY